MFFSKCLRRNPSWKYCIARS